ncbi:MAG: ABC transporter ATP-binding protein [Actinomycetaceae bacterium]|nr:ABC transporter ATP-binding protein/permease [Arcanobacterium sp.]MDD7504813.1 ABC transporter ATP-binding protein [Actinomycetaceae bacterium]MDY6142658.1 ABC transporter ATP-binding protein [Arcanobacterium sp.]
MGATTHNTVKRPPARKFEKGPEPKRWPHFTELDATPELPSKHLLKTAFIKNAGVMALMIVLAILQYVSLALLPWALNILLDSGIEQGITAALIPGVMAFLAFILASLIGTWLGFVLMFPYLRFSLGSARAIIKRVSGIRGGGKQKMTAGEIVAAITSDTDKIGNFAAQIGNTIGGLTAAGVVIVLMLRISVSLGLVVAIGTPVIIAVMALIAKPLQKKLAAIREEKGKLTTLAADAVTGLRVMRGVGGEEQYNARYVKQSEAMRDAGIRSAPLSALMGGLSTAVPAIFTAAVVGAGIWQYYGGELTLGELVAFYGYTGYLSIPIWNAQFFFFSLADSKVGSERIERVLSMEPLTSDAVLSGGQDDRAGASGAEPSKRDATAVRDWRRVSLRDETSGVVLRAGEMTAFVASDPDASAALVERLGRTDDSRTVLAYNGSPAEDAQAADGAVPLSDLPLAEVRTNIVLSGALAELFQGTLLSNIQGRWDSHPNERPILRQMEDTGDGSGIAHRKYDPHPQAPRMDAVDNAMEIADAKDILALGEGYFEHVAEQGRSMSGGQRQRVALARAVLTDAPILLLVEPTSAVDSHTESRIARALAANRQGRTTGVVTTSPIMLGYADTVVLLGADGHELARGTHHELLNDPRYRGIVHRASGEDGQESAGETVGNPVAQLANDRGTDTDVDPTRGGKE